MDTGMIKDNLILSKFNIDNKSIPVTSLFNERNCEGYDLIKSNKEELNCQSNSNCIDDEITKIREKVVEQENYISYLKSLLFKHQKNNEDAG